MAVTTDDVLYALVLLTWGAVAGGLIVLHFHPNLRPPRRGRIVATVTIEGTNMAKVTEGGTDSLKVVAKNAAGRIILPLPDAAVAVAKADDSVGGVDLATGNFTFTAGAVDGDDGLVATVAGVASAPYVETVVADNTVAAVEIAPQ